MNKEIIEILLKKDLSFINEYLYDDDISDIIVNPDGRIYIKKNGIKSFVKEIDDVNIVKKAILSIASLQEKIVDEKLPILETVIPYTNYRVEAILPPITNNPTIVVRKPTTKLKRLEEYVKENRMTEEKYKKIIDAIDKKYNIIIAGGTGSGKTTLLNSILYEIAEREKNSRIFLVEDTPEIVLKNEDKLQLVVLPKDAVESIRVAMRCIPDRIIFGEIRHGSVALELMKAWNTGHPGGVSTIHSDDKGIESIINRLTNLIMEEIKVFDKQIIYDTIDMVISIHRSNDRAGGVIEEIYDIRNRGKE